MKISSTQFCDKSLGEVETQIKKEGMEVMRLLTQGYLDQRSAQEQRLGELVGSDNEIRSTRRKARQRQVESLFGVVQISRIGYTGYDLGQQCPFDASLNLPEDKYSHGLRTEISHLLATQSFDETQESLNRLGGGKLPKRQMQEVCASLVKDFAAYYRQPLELEAINENKILVISADGKGISMHNQDLREATRQAADKSQKKKGARLKPGEKKGRKRMSTVVAVYDIDPYYRTPEQLFGDDESDPLARPKPQNKRVWAGIVDDMGTLIEQGFEEALRRDPKQEMQWVVLIDGQVDLIRQVEKKAEQFNVNVTITQDFIHVTEYLWKASHALHTDEQTREEWMAKRCLEILRGNAKNVASGLRRAATLYQLSANKRQPIDVAADYIENSSPRLKYNESLELGFPIATGVIEGACRYLVKDRMDLTGARWRLVSAEAVLKLRSLKASNHLDDYLQFHFHQEQQRNYHWAANDNFYRSAASAC